MNHSTIANGTQPATGGSAALAAAGLRDRSDPRLVLADRVEQLYSQLPLGIAATIVIGLIAALELREGRIIELVLFWGSLLLLVSALHAALYFAYRRSADKLEQGEQWLRWLGIGAFAAGVTWGFGASVFFPSHADERQVFLAFLLSGVMSGGIPVYAASWPIFAVYAAGIAIPFTYVLATFGNRLFVEIALLVPLFYGVSVAIAYRLNRVFHSGYRLRHAYGKLTEDYGVLNQRLERQLVELDEARRQVEASGRKLALFAERAPIAVLEIDPQGIVTAVNHAAELLFGYAAAELIGAHVKRLVLPEYHAEFDGHWRRQTEAERMKKEFTSTLSHELRTPLTSIIGALQLLNSGVAGELSKDVSELTLVAERNGQRLLDIINDILDIEKIESGRLSMTPEVLAIDGLVREAIVLNEGFGERFKVRFEARGELPGREVYADRKRMIELMHGRIGFEDRAGGGTTFWFELPKHPRKEP